MISSPKTKVLPPKEVLCELFRYEPETGKLFRKELAVSHFHEPKDGRGAQWVCNNYNSQNAGREAFTSSDKSGYFHGKIFNVNFQAHRVIWKMVHGEDPIVIDHINGNPSDNRLENLRACTVADNSRNYSKPSGSTSIYRGVRWVARDRSWVANISAGSQGKFSLGYFDTEIEAAKAYDAAARKYHGEFATLNFKDGGEDASAN